MRLIVLPLLLVAAAHAHAPILPAVKGPLRTQANRLLDATGEPVILRGLTVPGLETDAYSNAAALNAATFGVIRLRWNLNTVRLPVSVALWKRDGVRYLDRVADIVRLANAADLVAVLAAREDPSSAGLPSPDTLAFWREWAARFKDNPRVVYSLFHEPSARNVPGATAAERTAADWSFWLRGGTASGGQRAVGMQELTDAIRSTGAPQLIAVPAFHDRLGFQGLPDDLLVAGVNILYEAHPSYDFGFGDTVRQSAFGFLASREPLYAGEWGLELRGNTPGCTAFPRDVEQANRIVLDTAAYFEQRAVSWTAASFEPGSLVTDVTDYLPTTLDVPWNCDPTSNPRAGMGEALLLATTGDPTGFGYIGPDRIANSAGGPASPVAPGQLLSLFVEQLGPDPAIVTAFGETGRLPVNAGGTEVRFDGVPAPILYAGAFQINVQVPYSLVPGTRSTMQVWFQGVPSNRAVVDVVEAAPEIFHDFTTRSVIALNEDGSRNAGSNPAAPGSIVVLFASGGGETSPPGDAGLKAPLPHPRLTLPSEVTIDNQPGVVVFAGEVPGFTGLVQVNARLPLSITAAAVPRPVAVTLRVGSRTSRASVLLWIR